MFDFANATEKNTFSYFQTIIFHAPSLPLRFTCIDAIKDPLRLDVLAIGELHIIGHFRAIANVMRDGGVGEAGALTSDDVIGHVTQVRHLRVRLLLRRDTAAKALKGEKRGEKT